MSLDESELALPSATNGTVYCSGEPYRQCSPESCPGLTAQCTDRCVVVTCSDPHDGDHQGVCGDIICDDQSCTDPTDCHGIYEFLQCCNYHDYFSEPKLQDMDNHTTVAPFGEPGWDSAFGVLLGQGYQDGNAHPPAGYYNSMTTSPLTLTPGTVTAMTASSRSSTPSVSSPSLSHQHTHSHPTIFQSNHHESQYIANPSASFHNLVQSETSGPKSLDLSRLEPQSGLIVGQTEASGKHLCMWANCDATFGSLQDLVAHVNVQHLQTVSASSSTNDQPGPSHDSVLNHLQSALNPTDQIFPSCHWGNCQVYPTVENVPGSSNRPVDAALGVLAAHLWEYHLGLPTPPPLSPTPTMSATLVAENSSDLIQSVSLENVSPKVLVSPVEVEMMDVTSLPVSALPMATEADPLINDTLTSPQLAADSLNDDDPTQDEDHVHDQGHDCAKTDHPCKWSDCNEQFASCEALMAHITAGHVGSGKSHYGCFWDGCGRNGDKGFKSKQKICRHLQSHTGHRPHQCEVCQQCFSEAATLQQHMRRHTQEKPYECDYPGCGKRFAIMGALTIHKRTHNGDKPFRCPQCGKAFSESSNLSKHLRTHTGARPHVCPEPGCGKSFGRGDQLTRHMNVHSGGGKVVRKATVAVITEVM